MLPPYKPCYDCQTEADWLCYRCGKELCTACSQRNGGWCKQCCEESARGESTRKVLKTPDIPKTDPTS